MKSVSRALILVFMGFFALPAPSLGQEAVFPLACAPGATCFILSYPDMDDEIGSAKDYTCGPSANDEDSMLRIAMANVETLRGGIEVLATRAGKIIDVSDGIKDLVIDSKKGLKRGASLCGNGVVIDHGLGLQSAYCHLRERSIRVKEGQHVNAGDLIALAGQSGLATWPQLGFSMQSSGMFVDPISSMSSLEGCGFKPRPMIPLPDLFREYQPVAIVGMGFSTAPMPEKNMVLGRADTLSLIQMNRMEPDMNLWAMILGVRAGDKIEVRLRSPSGRTFEYREIIANMDEPRTPVNVTRARGYSGWSQGTYTGEITVTREVQYRPVTVSRSVTMIVR